MWLSTSKGVYRFDEAERAPRLSVAEHALDRIVSAPDGAFWRFRSGSVRRIVPSDR